MGGSRRLSLLAGLFLCGSSTPLLATGEPQEPARPALALGSLPTPPGSQIFVPLVLSVPEGSWRGDLVAEITFPSALLSYEGVTEGQSVDEADAEITASLEEDDKVATLKVSITGNANRIMGPGVLAYLGFRVALKAPIGEVIALELKVLREPAGASLKTTDGRIEVKVTDNPFFACFFYMH